MKVVIALLVVVSIAGVAQAAPAFASGCQGNTVASLRTCFNTKLRVQHSQIVSLKAQVRSLSSSTTIAGVSARVSTIENRIGCWGWGPLLAEYPASTYNPNPMAGAPGSGGTWLDVMHADNPAYNQTWRPIVSYC